MTQGSTASGFQTGVSDSESQQRSGPLDRAGASTHGRTDRPRLLRAGEVEPSWLVTTFEADFPRSVVLETAGDARDALGWLPDEVTFFLVDLDGGRLGLRVRGRAASRFTSEAVYAMLVAMWPEAFR